MVQNRSHDQVLPRCRTLITHPTDDESSRVESSRLPGHMEPTALSIDRMGVMISFSLGHRMNVSDPFLFFQGLCDDRERIVLFSRYRPQLAPELSFWRKLSRPTHPCLGHDRSPHGAHEGDDARWVFDAATGTTGAVEVLSRTKASGEVGCRTLDTWWEGIGMGGRSMTM